MAEDMRERVLRALEKRFPCAEVPHGTWAQLGREFGVSHERIRRIARDAGWKRRGSRRRTHGGAGPVGSRPETAEDLRALVLKALEVRYPCAEVPRGTWAQLGREFGVSHERIRQIARDAGWKRGDIRRRAQPICTCGKPMLREGSTCKACRWVTIECDFCGKGVRRLIQQLVTNLNDSRYTGRQFCSRKCVADFQRGKPRDQRGA